jgi:fibronectin-binding autotransporter adhesin
MAITTTPSGGPQGEFSTYTPIYSQTLSAAVVSVTFSNIPTTYTDLVIVINGFTSYSASADAYQVSFNGGSTGLSITRLYGNGGSASSDRYSTPYAGWTSTTRGADVINIMNYSNTTTYKTAITRSSSQGSYPIAGATALLWQSTNAITSVTLTDTSGSWQIGSTFTVYGIKAATTPPKATGGDQVYTDGTYWYHKFLNSGVFDCKQSLTADYLVVAGGGGGTGTGGGGAGGFRTSLDSSTLSLVAQQYSVVVGGGGAPSGYVAASGSNSSFSTITSTGGGGGNGGGNGVAGGSGGGAGAGGSDVSYSGGAGNAGSYSPVEGYAGGSLSGTDNRSGAGGGGAGAVGTSGSTNATGYTGGAGRTSSISGLSTNYAGGGGGGGRSYTAGSGTGSSYGGGTGGYYTQTAGAATVNTGGGGGGAWDNYTSGASGIVIVRYAV